MKTRILFKDLLSIASIAAVVASAGSALSLVLPDSNLLAGFVAFVFAIPVFIAVFIVLQLPLFYLSKTRLAWIYFPVFAGLIGFALPFAIGLLTALFPTTGAIGGVLGGLMCAWLWMYAHRYREKAGNRDRDSIFGTPSWLKSQRAKRR